ncbi:MAG: acyl-ACP desaturase [Bacteroidetes bacterium]|nr:acyl-ACP desaturase [Bacteroidota bacterium]
MYVKNVRLEVMATIEQFMDEYMTKFLIPIEDHWQPSDFLPDPTNDEKDFFEGVRELRELANELSYDFWAVLIGDTITEEALPTYESWLMDVQGIDQQRKNGWAKWVRAWTAEENRHGDLLNKFLYLSGKVNMREVEISTQYLINDGFDIGTDQDPYRNFVYTSFQELATYISHNRVAKIATQNGNKQLGKMCKIIAGDEMRHHHAYSEFVERIFKVDPSQMMMAFHDMMKLKITMPAHFLRESGNKISTAFEEFSNTAQRIGVYTSHDYVEILEKLITRWEIDKISGLTDEAEKARDYLMKLPARMYRLSERIKIPENSYQFKWVEPALIR